jgi:hypothetical protein
VKAYDAIHGLGVTLHYQSIAHGVGRPPKEEPNPPDPFTDP